jgi:hypothetical protein
MQMNHQTSLKESIFLHLYVTNALIEEKLYYGL